MARWKSLTEELGASPLLAALSDAQVEAVVDVLALVIYADETVAPIEVAGFNHLVFDLPWMEGRGELIRGYVRGSASRARQAVASEGAAMDLARAAASRLEGAELRELVLRMAASLAGVDMEVAPAEALALDRVAEAFEIDRARAREIVDATHRT